MFFRRHILSVLSLFLLWAPAWAQTSTPSPDSRVVLQVESSPPKSSGESDPAVLLKSIADLVSAVAWPAIVVFVLVRYRSQLGVAFDELIKKMQGAESLEFGWLKLIQHKSADIAAVSAATPGAGAVASAVKEQEVIRETRGLANAAQELASNSPDALPAAKRAMLLLAREYDTIRSNMASSPARTARMNRVVAQMRGLGKICQPFWDEFAHSTFAGSRLAAVAILQMAPDLGKLDWLIGRFGTERPFVFFHAALALRELAENAPAEARPAIRRQVQTAISRVQAFTGGSPDESTLDVLRSILESLPETATN